MGAICSSTYGNAGSEAAIRNFHANKGAPMVRMIFVNLPVKNLDRSMGFFKKLGFSFNPQFTDETAACMVISDTIFAMLLTEAKFREFTKKKIADANTTTEVL